MQLEMRLSLYSLISFERSKAAEVDALNSPNNVFRKKFKSACVQPWLEELNARWAVLNNSTGFFFFRIFYYILWIWLAASWLGFWWPKCRYFFNCSGVNFRTSYHFCWSSSEADYFPSRAMSIHFVILTVPTLNSFFTVRYQLSLIKVFFVLFLNLFYLYY